MRPFARITALALALATPLVPAAGRGCGLALSEPAAIAATARFVTLIRAPAAGRLDEQRLVADGWGLGGGR